MWWEAAVKLSVWSRAMTWCLVLAGLSANAWAQKNPEDITIGYSAMQLSNPWYISVRAGMVDACRKLGIKCVIIDAQNRVDKQVSDLQNMVHDRFDAIACTPLDAEALQDLYAHANSEGIITGSLAQIVPGSQLEYGMDEFRYGYTIGKQAAEWARTTLQCRGKAVLITQDNVLATIPRADGAEAALKEICPALNIVLRQEGASPEGGKKVVEEALAQHPDLDLAVSVTDAGGVGAFQAFSVQGVSSRRHAVFSGDATPEVISLMNDQGSIYRGTVDLMPYDAGYHTIEYLYDMVQNGAPAEPLKLSIPFEPVSEADVLSGKFQVKLHSIPPFGVN